MLVVCVCLAGCGTDTSNRPGVARLRQLAWWGTAGGRMAWFGTDTHPSYDANRGNAAPYYDLHALSAFHATTPQVVILRVR